VLLALQALQGRDRLGLIIPDARIDCHEVAAKILNNSPNLSCISSCHCVVSPAGVMIKVRLACPAGAAPADHARFDGLAQPDLIGQQKPPPRAGDDAMSGEDLVRQDLGPGVGSCPPCCR